MKRNLSRIVFITMLLALIPVFSFAGGDKEEAAYPAKNITYIIPFNPGGQSDIAAQYQKAKLEEALGVSVIIKHMDGAGGAVGWSTLAKAQPDGYTICGNNIPHIIAQPLSREDAGYKTEDLEPIYMFQSTPIGLAILKDKPYKTLSEFIDYARKHPGEITIGGSGTFSGHHLALLLLQKLAEVDFTYIPSTGAAPSVSNFLGGHTDALFANSSDLVSHTEKVIIIGMGTEERFSLLPDAPTFIEQGYDMTAGIDRGVCAPKGTPPEIIAVLEDAFRKACTDPSFMSQMEDMGMVNYNMGAAEFKAYVTEMTGVYTGILKELGLIQ